MPGVFFEASSLPLSKRKNDCFTKNVPLTTFGIREATLAKPIRIKVIGTNARGGDAPTVQNLLCQIQDQIELIRNVEEAVAADGKDQLEWRVTKVSMNSPITFELTPSAKVYGTDIEDFVGKVIRATAKGLVSLRDGKGRPKYFTDAAIKKASQVSQRVANGLAGTEVDFSEYDEPAYVVDHYTAHRTLSSISKIRASLAKPHKELGSLEGFVKSVGRDGHGRPILHLISRLDGTAVKCIGVDGGLNNIGHLDVDTVTKGLRINVYGTIHYKTLATVDRIDVDRVELFKDASELPGIDEIVEPGFTGGVEAVEYLRKLRVDG